MTVILLLIVSLTTKGELNYDYWRWSGKDMTGCRSYAKAAEKFELPAGIRDQAVRCMSVDINPMRSSRTL